MIFIIILMAMVITTIAIGMKLEKAQIILSGLFSLISLILITNMLSDYTDSKTVVTNVYEIKEIVGSFKTKESTPSINWMEKISKKSSEAK